MLTGHFCEKATVDPVTDSPCPIGTYMPYGYDSTQDKTVGTPAGRESDCIPCPGGSKCLPATVEPDPCPLGTYTKPGNSECATCLAG